MADGVQLFPIKCKNPVIKRKEIPTIQRVQKVYHKSLEAGRFLETSLADATHEAMMFKRYLEDVVKSWVHKQILGAAGSLPPGPSMAAFIIATINIILEMKKVIEDIVKVVAALVKLAQMLVALLKLILAAIQSVINALAKLIAEICNWNLPPFPAMPNLFGSLAWDFNGFNLGMLGLPQKPLLSFDKNFAFGQCGIKVPNINILRNYPTEVSVGGLTYGRQIFNPPIGGIIAPLNEFADPGFINQYLVPPSTSTPILAPSFGPTDIMGSLPNPNSIKSNFSLTPEAYANDLISLLPELEGLIPKTTDPDYEMINIPNDTDANEATKLRRVALFNGFSVYVTLRRIIDSDYDINLAAAWVLFLGRSRNLRQGLWLPEFQGLFDQVITPSYEALCSTPVPFNSFEDILKSSPSHLHLIDFLKAPANGDVLNHVCWKLSYIEASLLGYTRDTKWDDYANGFLSEVTKTDTDYAILSPSDSYEEVILSSDGKADYPQSVMVPTSHMSLVLQAIEKGKQDIENHPDWRTSLSQYRYIYDQFAQATEVDRYSQYWREWKGNFDTNLNFEKATLSRSFSYWQSLDSAVNPLGDSSISDHIRTDTFTRSSGWTPGDGLLNLPKAFFQEVDLGWRPDDSNSGWTGDTFDPTTFLSRPDIQALNIPTQMAMLDLNRAYASALRHKLNVTEAINTQLDSVNAAINGASAVIGFQIASNEPITLAKGDALILSLSTIGYDFTGNCENPMESVIQRDGDYVVACLSNTGVSATPAIRTLEVLCNGSVALTGSSDNTVDATSTGINSALPLRQGDVITIRASHSGLSPVEIIDTTISLMVSNPTAEEPITPTPTGTSPVGTESISALTAVSINGIGKLLPIHPESSDPTIPWYDGVTLGGGTANASVALAKAYGTTYHVQSANFTPGANFFVGPNGVLTQDFSIITSSCRWLICVGRAISPTDFLYEPNLPVDQQGGGGGGSVVVDNYVHVQSTPAAEWTITHNLGKYVPITLMYADGQVFESDIIYGTTLDPNDLNTIRVFNTRPVAGRAVCGSSITSGEVSFDFGEIV